MQRRTALSTVVSTAIGIGWLPVSSLANPAANGAAVQEQKPAQVTRQLRFSAVLSNPQGKRLVNQTLWMYLPITRTSAQDFIAVDTKIPYAMQTDAVGHSIIKIQIAELPPFAQRPFSLTVQTVQYSAPRPSDSGDQKDWLHTERFTEVSDSRVQAQARVLRASTPLQTARNIYEWVANNIAYAGFIADDLGAVYALTERKGDCTEYAFLVVALARANQIPARMVGGYVADRDRAPRADEYHNWAELYVEGAWHLVDAQKKNWLSPCADYTAFRWYRGSAINALGLAHRYAVDGDMNVRM